MIDPADRPVRDVSSASAWFVPRTSIPRWTPAEIEIIEWRGDGYPSALDPVLQRFKDTRTPVIRTGQGWWPLILRAHNDFVALDPGYVLLQVTEEHAELRLDAFSRSDRLRDGPFRDVIRDAENLSGRICEICGRQGRVMRQGNWLVTLCWDDADENGAHLIAPDEDFDDIVPRPTGRELAFALSAGVPPEAFTADGQAEQRAWVAANQRQVEEEIATWPGTADVGRLLGVSSAEVNRLRTLGRITATRDRSRRWRFAPWQIGTDGQLIPHLSELLQAAPADLDLVDLSHVMTEPEEILNSLSPVEWLRSGHGAAAVERILAELGIT